MVKNVKKKPVITDKMQRVAADILTRFAFVQTKEQFWEVWKETYNVYELCDDPFTRLPCSWNECAKNSLEYEKQVMMERYGHCDGLE